MKKTIIKSLAICTSFLVHESIASSAQIISPKQIVLIQNKSLKDKFIEEKRDTYVPFYVKTTIKKCVEKYPELTQMIDLSALTDQTRNVASGATIEAITREFIAILHRSNLSEIDPNDNTIAVMQRYLGELESIKTSSDGDATRIASLFNTNTGLAIMSGGILNIYGSTNVTTKGAGNTVSIGMPNTLVLTGLTGPGAVTVSRTGVLGSTQATASGQLLLGASGALPFFTGLSSPANPSGATSVIYASGPDFLSLQSVPLFANVIRVDWLNGNDATASVTNGLPYQTITAALAAAGAAGVASSVNPFVIWVMPGIYNSETFPLTMQQYVSVIGMSQGAGSTVTSGGSIPTTVGVGGVIIQALNVGSNTTMVTMAENSRLENVILNGTTTTAGVTLTGITISGTMSATARIKAVNLNLSTTTGTATGISYTGTGTPNPEISVLRECVICVNTGNVTATPAGINVSAGSGYFNITACNIAATTSNTNAISCYGIVNNASVVTNLTASTLSGTSTGTASAFDLGNLAAGSIVLTASRLVNNTADTAAVNNFTSTISPSVINWVGTGSVTASATNYLYPGTSTAAGAAIQSYTQFAAPQPCTIKSLRLTAGTPSGGSTNAVFTLNKNGVNQSLVAALTGAATSGQDLIHAVPFTGGDLISLQLTTAGSAAADIVATAEIY
jgi:hypothetical protein